MNFVAAAVGFQLLAVGFSLVYWRRLRDWRFALLALMLMLMCLRRVISFVAGSAPNAALAMTDDIAAMSTSLVALFTATALGWLVTERNETSERLRRERDQSKQAEAAWRDSQEWLAKVIATAPGVVCSYRLRPDGSTCFPFASPRIEEFYGAKPAALADDASIIFTRIHPDDVGHVRETIAESARSMRPWRAEYRVRSPVKGEIWLEGHSVPQREPDGSILWHGVVSDITERRHAEAALRASRQRLARLSRQLITAQESERRNVARELHDQIGQVLTAVGISLQQAQTTCDPAGRARIDESLRIVGQAIAQVRSLSLNLRPAMLDDFGLVPALRWCLDDQRRSGQTEIEFHAQTTGAALPAEVSTACYRIVQEAVTNAQRHAQAAHLRVELEQNDEAVRVSIQDDGVGFDVAEQQCRSAAGRSFGLLSMSERVELLDGRFELTSTPGTGTRIAAYLPITGADEADDTTDKADATAPEPTHP